MNDYSDGAVKRSRNNALEWLEDHKHGYPRSRKQEDANTLKRGYDLYDDPDFEAPPILGYEALEKEGLVVRREIVVKNDQERVHFELIGRLQ